MKKIIVFVIVSLFIITGCTNKSIQNNTTKESEEKMSIIKVIINNQTYKANMRIYGKRP